MILTQGFVEDWNDHGIIQEGIGKLRAGIWSMGEDRKNDRLRGIPNVITIKQVTKFLIE